jgi:hypothetical protein
MDWILIGILCIVAAVLLWIASVYLKDWLRARLLPSESPPPSSATAPPPSYGQWCFVGEDLTGRWCVKTPEEGLCPIKRSFQSRSECEMKTASASPLGITQQHDTTMIPIAGLSIA